MFNKPPVKSLGTAYVQVLMCRVCQIVGFNNYDLSYNYIYSIRHDTKQDTPRVGRRQRALVRNDSKRQAYPGNGGKVR